MAALVQDRLSSRRFGSSGRSVTFSGAVSGSGAGADARSELRRAFAMAAPPPPALPESHGVSLGESGDREADQEKNRGLDHR